MVDADFASSEPKARNQPREEETNNFDNGIGGIILMICG